MPYRRLPNTDVARIAALQAVIDLEDTEYKDNILSSELLSSVRTQLLTFSHLQDLYRQAVERWKDDNQKYRDIITNLTTHINNFVRAYHLAVETGEIDINSSTLYNIDNNEIPDLSTEELILDWGKRLIEGERKRIFKGGAPITNPTIASLNMYYEKFEDLNFNQRIKQNYIGHTKNKLNAERETTDQLIKKIWDTVDETFSHLPDEERIEKSKVYGVVYYERPSERSAKAEISRDTSDTELVETEQHTEITDKKTVTETIEIVDIVEKNESDDNIQSEKPSDNEAVTADETAEDNEIIVIENIQSSPETTDNEDIIIIDLSDNEEETTTTIEDKQIPATDNAIHTNIAVSKSPNSRIKNKYNDVPQIPFDDF